MLKLTTDGANSMNVDSAFVIGKRHEVCQDYAKSEVGKWASAFVSDGCSSSHDSDIGSRLLVLSAQQSVKTLLEMGWELELESSDDLSMMSISGAMAAAKILNLPSETLDATLLSIVSDGKRVSLSASGDGVLVLMYVDGRQQIVNIDFPSGYPDYLSYRIDHERRAKYDKLDQGGIVNTIINGGSDSSIKFTNMLESHKTYAEVASCSNPKLIMAIVMSDGVRSFYRRTESGENEPIQTDEVLKHLLDFKLFSGRFIQRRLNRFLKDVIQLGWEHHDDIGIAAIHFGD
jgi:hypothetical protein